MSDSDKDLLQVLLDNKVIGEAQAQVALKDQEMTGMPLDEVLIARRWVDRDTLLKHAPWLKEEKEEQDGDVYKANLQKYRQLMSEILGEKGD